MSDFDDFPWPSDSDDLLAVAAGNFRGIANVEGGWTQSLTGLATGYREGAEIIIDRVLETGIYQDYLVHPALFLYRHYIELRLKEIAICASRALERGAPPKGLMGSHAIEPLWTHCRRLVEELEDGEGAVADLDNAERILKQLAWADPGSYSFRYPTDKSGDRSLPTELRELDLQQVRNILSALGNLLDAIVDEVDRHEEWKAEMHSWADTY